MKAVVTTKSAMECTLEIQVDAAEVRSSYERQLSKAARMVAVPGFRKGKAPRHILERRVDQGMLRGEIFQEVGVPAYAEALKQESLLPLGEPSVEFVEFAPGQDLIFRATFEIRPEFAMEPADYEGLEVAVAKSEVTDEDVVQVLEGFQRRAERLVSVDEERGLEMGDVAVVDFKSRVGDEDVPNGTAQDFQLDLDDSKFVSGFSQNLVGLKVGEERTFDFLFPESYSNANLAGKNVTFGVTLKGIKKRIVPDLSDDLAAEVSGYASLDEFKVDIRRRLEERSHEEIGTRAMERLAEKKDFPTPQAFIQRALQLLAEAHARQIAQAGIAFEDYLKHTGLSVDKFLEPLRPQALRVARLEQVRDAIVRTEGFDATAEEVEADLVRLAKSTNQDVEQLRKTFEEGKDTDAMKRDIVRRKVFDFLVARTKVVAPEPPAEPVVEQEPEAVAAE